MKCNGCMRFRATAFTRPAPGKLPQDRTTTGGVAFEVIGTDFAGPIRYKRTQKKERISGHLCVQPIPSSALGASTKYGNRYNHFVL